MKFSVEYIPLIVFPLKCYVVRLNALNILVWNIRVLMHFLMNNASSIAFSFSNCPLSNSEYKNSAQHHNLKAATYYRCLVGVTTAIAVADADACKICTTNASTKNLCIDEINASTKNL